eukprot:3193466-Rhodomonas_salina.1
MVTGVVVFAETHTVTLEDSSEIEAAIGATLNIDSRRVTLDLQADGPMFSIVSASEDDAQQLRQAGRTASQEIAAAISEALNISLPDVVFSFAPPFITILEAPNSNGVYWGFVTVRFSGEGYVSVTTDGSDPFCDQARLPAECTRDGNLAECFFRFDGTQFRTFTARSCSSEAESGTVTLEVRLQAGASVQVQLVFSQAVVFTATERSSIAQLVATLLRIDARRVVFLGSSTLTRRLLSTTATVEVSASSAAQAQDVAGAVTAAAANISQSVASLVNMTVSVEPPIVVEANIGTICRPVPADVTEPWEPPSKPPFWDHLRGLADPSSPALGMWEPSSGTISLHLCSGATVAAYQPLNMTIRVVNPSYRQEAPPLLTLSVTDLRGISQTAEADSNACFLSSQLEEAQCLSEGHSILRIDYRFEAAAIRQSNPLGGLLNLITVSVAVNFVMRSWLSNRITIGPFRGVSAEARLVLLEADQGADGHLEFCDSDGEKARGAFEETASPGVFQVSLDVCERSSRKNGELFVFSFEVRNSKSRQDPPDVKVEVVGIMGEGVRQTSMLQATEQILGLPRGAAAMFIYIPSFRVAQSEQTSPIAKEPNLLTFVAQVDVDLGTLPTSQPHCLKLSGLAPVFPFRRRFYPVSPSIGAVLTSFDGDSVVVISPVGQVLQFNPNTQVVSILLGPDESGLNQPRGVLLGASTGELIITETSHRIVRLNL